MSRLKRVLKTDVGIATGITFVIAVLYIVCCLPSAGTMKSNGGFPRFV